MESPNAISAIGAKGEGAYGAAQIVQPGGLNHVIGYVNSGGSAVFVDAQIGQVVTLSNNLNIMLGEPIVP